MAKGTWIRETSSGVARVTIRLLNQWVKTEEEDQREIVMPSPTQKVGMKRVKKLESVTKRCFALGVKTSDGGHARERFVCLDQSSWMFSIQTTVEQRNRSRLECLANMWCSRDSQWDYDELCGAWRVYTWDICVTHRVAEISECHLLLHVDCQYGNRRCDLNAYAIGCAVARM